MSRKKDVLDPISAVPVSGHHARSSDVVFQKAEQPSSARARADATLPPAWAERILRVAWETPVDGNDEVVLREMLDALAELLPAFAVGATCARSEESADEGVAVFGASVLVVRRLPAAEVTSQVVSTAERVFPELSYEASASVPSDGGHVTLHVAAEAQTSLDDSSLAMSALRRAILLLARNLENARTRAVSRNDGQAKRILAAQMVQADKLASLGQIAAGIVHELNNPLTSIVAYSEYLVKRWLARSSDVWIPHELERLQRISDSANRLLRFTRDLVTYARPASDPWMPISLHGIIDRAVLFCEHLLSENKTTVVKAYSDKDLAVRGSPEQLTQVLVNLFTNACQAMAAGGVITVSTEPDSERAVRIVVHDAGHGIDAAHLGHVFSPFFTTKPAGRGTGLGLSIVKSIIDSHEGQIWAESEPQQGARFIIVLPHS